MAYLDSPEVLNRFQNEFDLVKVLATQIRRDFRLSLDVAELESFGMEGLLTAARRFDPDIGVPFRKYAYHRVRGAILDGVRSMGSLSRRTREKARALQAANLVASGFFDDSTPTANAHQSPQDADTRLGQRLAVLATAMAIGFNGRDTVVGGERITIDSKTSDTTAEHQQLMDLVKEALPTLSDQESEMIRRHFFRDQDIDEIAASMGISKSWGSRIITRAITKLSKRLTTAV